MKYGLTALWICFAALGTLACREARTPNSEIGGANDGNDGEAGESGGGTMGGGSPGLSDAEALERLKALSPDTLPPPLADPTNRFADDQAAAVLGKKFFFDTRFSGPLLDDDNTGLPGTLGKQGEAGKVACVSCHDSRLAFDDRRSPKAQISLASSWTRRRTPSLLDINQTQILMWDGRRDAAFNQVFGVVQNPIEFNSSISFVAQQVVRYYRAEYEGIFGPIEDLSDLTQLDATDAGCTVLEEGPTPAPCSKPADNDPRIVRIVVNLGKAIQAYERLLTCGPGRFDDWIHGDESALDADEQAGAMLFVRAGCDNCHTGPFMSDQKFYNIGSANFTVNFIEPFDDPGAAIGLTAMLADSLNSKGVYSDGYDDRLEDLPTDLETLRGAFRTPTLRCVAQRPSFGHAGQTRTLEDFMVLMNRGGDPAGYQGEKDPRIIPLNLTAQERTQIVKFMGTLNGPGPSEELRATPELPEL